MKTKQYNWHFWIPQHKTQVIIQETCFNKANNKVIELFHTVWKKPIIKFQFGEIIK